MPKNIAREQALAQRATELGLIKDGYTFKSFIAEKTGIAEDDVAAAFTPRQTVALTQAIRAHENQSGYILGDMMGVGKGRVIAGMALYAMRRGIKPIFITKDHKLYKDMLRDLKDIGAQKIFKTGRAEDLLTTMRVLATDDKAEVKMDEDGIKVEGMGKKDVDPNDYDMVFTTYSQLQPIGGQSKTKRHKLVRSLAAGSMLLMDESHKPAAAIRVATLRLRCFYAM